MYISYVVIFPLPTALKWSWIQRFTLGGDEFAISTVNFDKSEENLILTAFMTSIVIAFTGLIGFVGLAAPHMARLIVGNDFQETHSCSAVFGYF